MAVRLFRLLIVAFLATALLLPQAASAPDPNPSIDTWVEGTIELAQTSFTEVDVGGEIEVRQYVLGGETYSAQELREAYAAARAIGEGAGEAFLASLESSLESQVGAILQQAFPTATTREVESVRIVRSSLGGGGADEFDPPVEVDLDARVVRDLAGLGLGAYSSAAVDAIFEAGAQVETEFTPSAAPGYALDYVLSAPPGLLFTSPSEGTLLSDGLRLRIERDNAAGTSTLAAPVRVTLDDPAHDAPTQERVDREIDMRFGAVEENATGLPVNADFTLSVHTVNIAERFPTALPPRVTLAFIDADGIRELRAVGAITDAMLARAEESLLAGLAANLTQSFGAPADVTGSFDAATLGVSASAKDAPLIFRATGVGVRPFEGETGESVDLALDIGAAVAIDLDFAAGSGTSTYVLHAPPGISFEEVEGGTLAEDGSSIRFVATQASPSLPASIVLRSDSAPEALAQEAALDVLVDIKDLDVALGEAIGGDFGELVIDVTVTGEINVMSIPEELRSKLDANVRLDYVTSDAIRLLRERGVLSDAEYAELQGALLDRMEESIESALGADVYVEGGFVPASMDVALVSDPPSSETPVLFRATTTLRKALSPEGDANAQAAIALYTTTQSFTFPRIQGIETTYTVVLPKGLEVTSLETDSGDSQRSESDDGRSQFTVTPSGERSTTTVSMAVTPMFIVAKFFWLVVAAVVLVLLVVGTPIALVVRSRRKGRGGA